MWAWVLSGPCHLGHVVLSMVAGVVVGGRDLNRLILTTDFSY